MPVKRGKFKITPHKPPPVREAKLSWQLSSIENSEFAPLLEICTMFEVVAHLDITDEGIKQLVHLQLAPEKQVLDLNTIPFIQIEGALPPYELPAIGSEGYAVIWNRHQLTSAIRNFGDIAVVPPYRFDSAGLSFSVRGMPKGISDFVKIIKILFPPDVVKVVELEKDNSGLEEALTEKQQTILSEAVKHGYYARPREIGLGELADKISIPRSSLSDLLSRLESNLATWAFEQLE